MPVSHHCQVSKHFGKERLGDAGSTAVCPRVPVSPCPRVPVTVGTLPVELGPSLLPRSPAYLAGADYLVRRQRVCKVGAGEGCQQQLCGEQKLRRPGEKMPG